MPERYVITGASGKLGRRTAELALQRSPPGRLILVTRNPAALADLAARGVDVRFGDFSVPESLSAAFAGATRLLLVSTADLERRAEQHRVAIAAAVAAGVRQLIYTSIVSPEPPNPAVVAPSHYATERALAESGQSFTVLRNSLYADFQLPEAVRALETGTLAHNRGSGRIAYVTREDCAAVAAAVLTSDGHEGRVYDVTGPEAFTANELAALYAELGDRPVEPIELTDAELVARLVGSSDRDAHMRYGAELVASFGRAMRDGYFASCTQTVEQITGRPARALRAVLAAGLRSAREKA
jgi:NAD(P)H dehydrogenase (quinone)